MPQVTVSIHIALPVEEVFAAAADFENAASRIKGIARGQMLAPGPVRVGTRFRETRIMFQREATEEMEVTAREPNRSYSLSANSCGTIYSSTLRFQPENHGTRVTLQFSGRLVSLLAKLMAPLGFLMNGMLKKCIRQDLEDLKAALENEPASVQA
jgi:carbon monoxide dehydrogenase subunit G